MCPRPRRALHGYLSDDESSVANGSPLDFRFDNVARAGLRAGYHPVVFGYTDQGADPRQITDPDDPRLSNWEGVLPGFDEVLCLDEHHAPWLEWLRELGYEGRVVVDPDHALDTENERPAEHSVTQFLTDRFLQWLDEQPAAESWFAHTSFIRPHPPYVAAGHYAAMYSPADCPAPLPIPTQRHHLHDVLLSVSAVTAPTDPDELAHLQAQYFGMISEVDAHVGRICDALKARGEWDSTLIIITADHAEQLGDQGLQEKCGWFESSYHILGIVRDPAAPAGHGTVVTDFTENVDIMPTLCEAIGVAVPVQCDGMPLTELLRRERPPLWRTAAHYEWDWRDKVIPGGVTEPSWDRRLERHNLAVLRTDTHAYVQFGNGDWLCYDLAADPTWLTTETDAAVVLPLAQQMLLWRQHHLDRTLTGMLLRDGGIGRLPAATATG